MNSTSFNQPSSDTVDVYVGLTGDFIHHGHINLLSQARLLGQVTVGLLTDHAVSTRKRIPALTFDQRRIVIENIVGVGRVVPQDEWDYSFNLQRYRPRIMVHGDDWIAGPDAVIRAKCLSVLESYGGKLVEIPFTPGVSSEDIVHLSLSLGTTPDVRRASLRRMLAARPTVRLIEAHSPLSALVAERASLETEQGIRRFDGFWSSSLTDSTLHGKPDTESFDFSSRLNMVGQIFAATSLPLVFDGDTGGHIEHFQLNVRDLERLGVSAVVIEDKMGLKKNSLLGTEVDQFQEDPETFANKISAGKQAQLTSDFMIIARVESLILEKGMDDALARAKLYASAGADGIMIHSRAISPDEVIQFAKEFRRECPLIPLVCVPTSYNNVNEEQLGEAGFNVIIYANHMLRASHLAMKNVAASILRAHNSSEAENFISSVGEILNLIPGTR